MYQNRLIGFIESTRVDLMTSAIRTRSSDDAPAILALAAHQVRWRLLHELVRSDRTVSELSELLGERQSLVSYHLTQLRNGGLVRVRRSSADGRDSYYAVDLADCGEQLQAAGGALHPALRLAAAPPPARAQRGSRRRPSVLFLCTGNSARSQMAEAMLREVSAGTVKTASAGSHPKPLHPLAVRVMQKRGLDISSNRTKHLDEFLSQRFDVVVTLCDRVREVCPEFPSHPVLTHWSVPDPALVPSGARVTVAAFERTATELEDRIRFLLPLLDEPSARRSTHARR